MPTEPSSDPTNAAQPTGRGLSIRLKILSPAVVALALLILVGVVGLLVAADIRDRATQSYSDDTVGTGQVLTLSNLVYKQWTNVLDLSAEPVAEQGRIAESRTINTTIDATVADIRRTDTDGAQVDELAAFETAWRAFEPDQTRAFALYGDPATYRQASDLVHGGLEDRFSALTSAVDALVSSKREAAVASNAANGDAFNRARNIIILLTAVSVAGALALALLLSGRMANAVGEVASAAREFAAGRLDRRAAVVGRDEVADMAGAFNALAEQLEASREAESLARQQGMREIVAQYQGFVRRVAQGDLTVRLSGTDDSDLGVLATDMNSMVGDLAGLSSQVRDASAEMSQASAAILTVVSQHSAATTEQAASISQTSVTVDEVRATSEQASARAEQVASEAQEGLRVADEGAAAVASIVEGMDDVRLRVAAIATGMERLSGRASAIGVITQTVNDLADQSNMLALNATIEAAKAGEQGKGFAVVADEVRKLAEQSKAAVSQVQQILTEINDATREAELATNAGTQSAEESVDRAARAGDAITRMSETMRSTAQAATAIAASVREQHMGMSQIGQAMHDVSTTTSQIAASANDLQNAAHMLSDLGGRLESLTGRYVTA
jgi:methyl-accepting chemotaxis protein